MKHIFLDNIHRICSFEYIGFNTQHADNHRTLPEAYKRQPYQQQIRFHWPKYAGEFLETITFLPKFDWSELAALLGPWTLNKSYESALDFSSLGFLMSLHLNCCAAPEARII